MNMLIDKNFMGLEERYCLTEKFLCMHAYECLWEDAKYRAYKFNNPETISLNKGY